MPIVRPATEADGPAILDLYSSLSEDALRMRFFAAPYGDALARAARIDPATTVAWVAVASGRVVGEARCVVTDDGEQEFALVVHEEYHRRGVASMLLDALREQARSQGIERLRAVVRTDNGPMLRMVLKLGCAVVVPAAYGEVAVEVSTGPGMPSWPAGDERPRVLVESRGWWQSAGAAALRRAGYQVRTCVGPNPANAQPCPLLVGGACRLVEEADVVVCELPETDAECVAVAEAHRRERPDRLSQTSSPEVLTEVQELLAQAINTQSPSSTC